MKTRLKKRLAAILPGLVTLLLFGCVQPDHWRSFEPAWLALPAETVEPIVIPEELQPRRADGDRPAVADGQPLDLAVEQAIWLALENNQDLRVRRLTPLIAGTFEAIERGVYDPELFGELEFSEEKSLDPDPSGARTVLEESDRNLVVGVRQELPSGTIVEGSVAQSSNDTNLDPREESARLGLNVTQALLRGAGPVVNLVSVRQAELNTAATIFELRGVTEALLADTEIAYWEYVLAGQRIDIFEKSLAIALQQLDEIEQRIEVGTLPRIEAAAARAEVARREQALIDVRSRLEENRLRLVRFLNPAGDGRLDFRINATSAAGVNPEPITDLNDRLLLAAKSRPDLAEARLRLRQNRLQTIVTRNGLLPRLDLFISLGKTGYADSFSGAFRNLDDNTHDLTAGIRLSQYLNNRQAKARDLAARASWQQATESVDNLKQIISLDVRLAVNEVERARQLIGATKVTRILQEETLKAEKERFDVGASTALLVAQAQRDLLVSAIVEVEVVVNYRKSLVNLYLAEGSLLERRGVSLTASQ
jgi:outer membrane protein TolC